MRILIVEDNPDAGATLRMVLQALGHDIRHVHDGESALDIAPVFTPHVILLDLGLPGMTGHDAARLLRKADIGENVMIIAISGWGRREDHDRSLAAGVDHHLEKPVDWPALKALLPSHPDSTS